MKNLTPVSEIKKRPKILGTSSGYAIDHVTHALLGRIHPAFIPGNRAEVFMRKNFPVRLTRSRLETRDLGTESTRPFIWTHQKFYEGFRGKTRSRKSGQLARPGPGHRGTGAPGSCEEALSNRGFFTCQLTTWYSAEMNWRKADYWSVMYIFQGQHWSSTGRENMRHASLWTDVFLIMLL